MSYSRREVDVSPEYLEEVCDWLEDWTDDPNNKIIAQFCCQYGIGFNYLKHFISIHPRLANIYEVAVATLCVRWFSYADEKDKIPFHMNKVLMKYLRSYDQHSLDLELQMKKDLINTQNEDPAPNFQSQNYAQEKLNGTFKKKYDHNVNKRRS